jgi:hypothetical protein
MCLPSPKEGTTVELSEMIPTTNYRRPVYAASGLLDLLPLMTVIDQWHEFVKNLEVHLLGVVRRVVVGLSMANEKAHDFLELLTLQLIPSDFIGSDPLVDLTSDVADSLSWLLRVDATDVVWICFQSLRPYRISLNRLNLLTGQQPDLGLVNALILVVDLYFLKIGLLGVMVFDCSMNLRRRRLTVRYFQKICIRPINIAIVEDETSA